MKWILITMMVLFSNVITNISSAAAIIKPEYNDYSNFLINKNKKENLNKELHIINPIKLSPEKPGCNYMNNDYRHEKNDNHGCAVDKNRYYSSIGS